MLILVFLFVIGTIVGSFLNVCIHRLPRGESIIYPSSHCPVCGHKLSWLDLIPIFSYIYVLGKCRYCKVSVSLRYPLVEILSGVSFVLAAVKFPPAFFILDFVFSVVFIALMLVVFFVDLEHQVIPDVLSVSGILVGLTYNFLRALTFSRTEILNPFLSALLGMLLGYVLFYLIGFLGRRVFKKEAIGEGDLFLAAMLGACFGWHGVLVSIFMAYLLAGSVSLFLLALGKVKLGQYIAFGPALAVAGVVTLFFGQNIIGWYLSLFL